MEWLAAAYEPRRAFAVSVQLRNTTFGTVLCFLCSQWLRPHRCTFDYYRLRDTVLRRIGLHGTYQ